MSAAEAGETVEAARSEIDRVLRTGDWGALRGRLAEDVVLVDGFAAYKVERVSGDHAWRWLQERWQPGAAVIDAREIIHYGLLEVEAGPWLVLPPSGPTLYLNAHRYDETGQQDPSGKWMIDAVTYGEKN